MQLKMVGIDHNLASIEQREIFSFTREESLSVMKEISNRRDIFGCLILSTCNRTEFWVSGKKDKTPSPKELLCEIKKKNESNNKYFVCREDSEAIDHLLKTTCGMNSKIFGEDQILTQIKDALCLARECEATDKVIEKVFQSSISAGKKVKSTVPLTNYNPSVADNAIKKINEEFGNKKGLKALVIGNGKMAALMAKKLQSEGISVKMTLRKKYHIKEESESVKPEGIEMVPYDLRYTFIEESDIVVSATLSPHYTLELDNFKDISVKDNSCFIDLAVPRDIDALINKAYNISLYDIDSLGVVSDDACNKEDLIKARNILENYRCGIEKWILFRKQIDEIQDTTYLTKVDATKRFEDNILHLPVENEIKDELKIEVEDAIGRAVNKLLCGLKDTLPEEHWEMCFNSLKESAAKETIKK